MSTQVLHQPAHGCHWQLSPQHSPFWSVQTTGRSQTVPEEACNTTDCQQCCKECSHHLFGFAVYCGAGKSFGIYVDASFAVYATSTRTYCLQWSQPPDIAVGMDAAPTKPTCKEYPGPGWHLKVNHGS